MLFARFLAENGLLMHPDGVPLTLDECNELAHDEGAADGWELAGRYASRMLPQIFRPDSPVLALKLAPEHQRALENRLASLHPDCFQASDSLGWVYQFWQTTYFEQHFKLFHHRPFIWHIWDGLKDGFAALVNYHKLDRANLERLIYTYLGDWIRMQERAAADGAQGADERLAAAKGLKTKLEAILEGEAPLDIFVRWKPIEAQPIGWEPDLNDGVRLNIRPFLLAGDVGKKGAGILRAKANIHWKKDRGKDVESAPWYHRFQGDRINDHHLTLAEKRAARSEQ